MEEKKKKKQQQQSVRTDNWLQPNIVVKVVTKRLGEKYHKKKAVIMVIMLCLFCCVNAKGKRSVMLIVVDGFAAGAARQIRSGGEDDRLRRQTETGPESRRNSHTCTR